MKKLGAILVLLVFIATACSKNDNSNLNAVSTEKKQTESEVKEILMELYNATGGKNWGNQTNWGSELSLKEWYGVDITLDNEGYVSELLLYLDNNNLVNSLPKRLGELTPKLRISFQDNLLSGNIPDFMYSNIEELNLKNNNLEGAIPQSISKSKNLSVLDLSENKLNCELPETFKALTRFSDFTFNPQKQGSAINGAEVEIDPKDKANLIALYDEMNLASTGEYNWREAGLSACDYKGVIFNGYGKVTCFDFWLDSKYSLPKYSDKIYNFSELASLYLGSVEETATRVVPVGISKLTKLKTLILSRCDISANIDEIYNLVNLTELQMYYSTTTQSISPKIANLTNLKFLSLQGCSFMGELPIELFNLEQLQWLNIIGSDKNIAPGAEIVNLPSGKVNMKSLEHLTINNYNLGGEIPASYFDHQNIRTLKLTGNKLASIPSAMSKVITIEEIDLSCNLITGSIPAFLGELPKLRSLNLNSNLLTGTIPDSFRNKKMDYLHVNFNKLSGVLPAFLDDNIISLNIVNNNFSGALTNKQLELSERPAWRLIPQNEGFGFDNLAN